MKKILVVLFISIFVFFGCSSEYETTLTLQNIASGAIYLNFRGEVTKVPAGKTVVLNKLPKGTYSFITTYEVPANVNSSVAVGDLEGDIIFNPGTKVRILYSSNLSQNIYTIYASLTSNEDISGDGKNPLFP